MNETSRALIGAIQRVHRCFEWLHLSMVHGKNDCVAVSLTLRTKVKSFSGSVRKRLGALLVFKFQRNGRSNKIRITLTKRIKK